MGYGGGTYPGGDGNSTSQDVGGDRSKETGRGGVVKGDLDLDIGAGGKGAYTSDLKEEF